MFAVSFVGTVDDTRVRRIRMFSRGGSLLYTSERTDGLERCLAWRSSGSQLIASTQTTPVRHQVCFFEKNGLRHGDFALPYAVNTTRVSFLMWNKDADALIVCATTKDTKSTQLLVYTCSNYRWSAKQHWRMEDDVDVLYLQWDDIDSQRCIHTVVKVNQTQVFKRNPHNPIQVSLRDFQLQASDRPVVLLDRPKPGRWRSRPRLRGGRRRTNGQDDSLQALGRSSANVGIRNPDDRLRQAGTP